MPEMRFIVRWPDDAVIEYYSPSLVVRDYLEAGARYTLRDFVERSRIALRIASHRVREKYGFACPRAARQLARIEEKARQFADFPDAAVRVESYGAARVESYDESTSAARE
jgi:uncharacterized repeat protein (TIGR04042 family)